MIKNIFLYFIPIVVLVLMINDRSDNSTLSLLQQKQAELKLIESEVIEIDEKLDLGPVIDNWMAFRDFAVANGASVEYVDEGYYLGSHASYSGILTGKAKYAIAIVGELQGSIPLVLHSINISESIAEIKVSVLGVDQ
jgi:hypothetical protein